MYAHYITPSQRSQAARVAVVRTFTGHGWTFIESANVRGDFWLRFRCGA